MSNENKSNDSNDSNEPPITPGSSVTPDGAPKPPSVPVIGGADQAAEHDPNTSSIKAGDVVLPPSQKAGRGKKFLLFLVLVIVIAAAVVGYLHYHKTQTQKAAVVTTKKDIPYVTYGFNDSYDMTPNYPLETSDDVNTIFVDYQVYDSLVRFQDQTKLQPWLATSWTNPDNTTWIFNLRHGVKFHTGRTMTADDVKFSLDYAVAHQKDNNGAATLYLASTIKDVTVVGPYQVKITTTAPDAVLLGRLANLFIVDSKAKLGDPNAGSGPYMVKAGTIKPNATSLDLVAVNNYWAGHVYTRAVHFAEETDIDQLAKDAAAGKFDMSGDYGEPQIATIKSKTAYYKPIVVPDLGVHYVQLNTAKASIPFHTLAARQAAAYALDYKAILKAGGLTGTQASQVIPSTLPGYDPSIKATPYDPAKAKSLLATVPNASAPIVLNYPEGDEALGNEIVTELNAVGFHATGKAQSFDTLLSEVDAGTGDMFYLGYTTNTLDGLDMINGAVANTPNYTTPQLTDLLNQASGTLDPSTRITALQKTEQLIAKDIPTIPLFTETRTYALTKPYNYTVDMPGLDAGTYFWQMYQQ